MYRIPDNSTDEARAQWTQDTVKKIDAARDAERDRSGDDARTFLKRKGHPATLPWDKHGDLLYLYLDQYTKDERFAKALVNLCEDNKSAVAHIGYPVQWWQLKSARKSLPDDARHYVERIEAFVADWKLDWLSRHRGRHAVLGWCWLRNGHPGVSVESFAHTLGAGGEVPCVGEKVPVRTVLKYPDGNEIESEGFNIEPPKIRIAVELSWAARYESPAAIYERLMRACSDQITPQLMRWYRENEAAGYSFRDTENEADKYASWTYRRFVHDQHFKDIAKADFAAAESVRLRTNEFAKSIGLEPIRTRRRETA